VHEPKGAHKADILKVFEIGPYLKACELAFVDYFLTGKGCYVETNCVFLYGVLYGVGCVVAQYKELSLEHVLVFNPIGWAKKHLLDGWLYGEGGCPNIRCVHWYASVTNYLEP
jgi:hypothetical protein